MGALAASQKSPLRIVAMVVLSVASVNPTFADHAPSPREVLGLLRRADRARLVILPAIGPAWRSNAGCSYELPPDSPAFIGLIRLFETSLALVARDNGLGFAANPPFVPTMTLIFSGTREEVAELTFEDQDRTGLGVQMRMEKIAPPWNASRYRMTAINNFIPKLMDLSKSAEVHLSCN